MKKLLIGVSFLFLLAFNTKAQSALPPASPHGVQTQWQPAGQGADTNPIIGYNLWRCPGGSTGSSPTCSTTSTNWTQLNTTPIAATSYLDPAANLTTGSTYSYVVYTQDSIGNTSAPSNIATVTLPSTFPVDPNAPANLTVVSK